MLRNSLLCVLFGISLGMFLSNNLPFENSIQICSFSDGFDNDIHVTIVKQYTNNNNNNNNKNMFDLTFSFSQNKKQIQDREQQIHVLSPMFKNNHIKLNGILYKFTFSLVLFVFDDQTCDL